MLDCAPNFRDLGGYATVDGRTVARGRVYRSQVIVSPTEHDQQMLRQIGFRYVCDLRGARERSLHPNRWPEGMTPRERSLDIGLDVRAGAERLLAILVDDPNAAGVRRMMMVNYSLLPNAFAGGKLGWFLSDLATGDGFPAIVHCTAGKDRTGFASAMLLTALGVSRESVMHDYMLTERFIDFDRMMDNSAHYLKSIMGEQAEPDEAMLRMLCGVEIDYLDAAFAEIEQAYGSIEAYLELTAGLDAATRERLRGLMLE